MVIVPYVVSAIASYAFSYAVQWAFGKDTHQYGPKLGDTRVQVSTYGKTIPQVFGAIRTAGNVIWATPLQETAHTQSQGGKGSPHSQSYTSYTYSASFAVSLCSTTHPDGTNTPIAGIGRIWADGKLIYNGMSTDPGTIIAGSAVTPVVYLGTETQMPDPTIQAWLGASNVPAYRGQAYVVFNDMQLEQYGNRIPNIEVEIVSSATSTYVLSQQGSATTDNTPQMVGVAGNYCYVLNFYGKTLQVFNAANPTNPVLYGSVATGVNPYSLALSGNYAYVATDYFTSSVLQVFDTSRPEFPVLAGSVSIPQGYPAVAVSGNYAYVATASDNLLHIFDITWHTNPVPVGSISIQPGSSRTRMTVSGNYLYYVGNSLTLDIYDISAPLTPTLVSSTPLPAGTNPYSVAVSGLYAYIVDYTLGKFMVYNISNPASPAATGLLTLFGYPFAVEVSGNYAFVGNVGLNTLQIVDITNPAAPTLVTSIGTGPNPVSVAVSGNYAAVVDYGNVLNVMFFASGIIVQNPAATTVGSIVSALCSQVGVTAIDVSALTDQVDGYIVGSQMTARGAIEPLQKAFYFDAVESDNLIKFVKRGTRTPIVISEDDLAAHDAATKDVPATVEPTRAQELELPKVVNTSYYNTGNNYLQGAQYASRQITNSQQTMDMQLPISMTDAKGKQVADVNLYVAWTARNTTKFSTSRKYDYLDPTDAIQVTKANGVQYNMLLMKRTEKPGGLIEWDAVTDDPSVYTQTAAASSPGVSVVTTIGSDGYTHTELLDIPLLNDADNDAGFYTAADGYSSGWSGGALVKSSDNVSFSQVSTFPVPGAVMGTVKTVLGNFTGGNTFDESNSVTVVVDQGTLASVQTLDVLNGQNACVIGNEVLQFRNATLTAANTYVLTGFLRGRVGTEQFIGTHVVGERFVLLSATTIQRLSPQLSEVGLTRYYKGVSNNQAFSAAPLITFANTAAGLKPLSPVQIGGGRDASGNLTINWTRRTRIGGGWSNSTDVPLGEATESYSIDIMNGSTVVRTLTSTTPTVNYTSAQQVTDFGSNQAAVTVNIYQISASVGRGFPGTAIV